MNAEVEEYPDVSPLENSLFVEAVRAFEEQFDCELDPTGYEFTYSENDGVGSVEYFAHGLIDCGALPLVVGGWVDHDVRDNRDFISLLFGLKLDGELVGDCKALRAEYDPESKTWSPLRWESI